MFHQQGSDMAKPAAGQTYDVHGEKRTVLSVGRSSVWYRKPNGKERQCSLESWALWARGYQRTNRGA